MRYLPRVLGRGLSGWVFLAMGMVLAANWAALADGAPAPQLRQSSGTEADENGALVMKMLVVNGFWLFSVPRKLAYTFEMQHVGEDDKWSARVEFTQRDQLNIQVAGGKPYQGKVDDAFDRQSCARPPVLATILQGTTFWGPLQDWAYFREGRSGMGLPPEYKLEIIGEGKLAGKPVEILQLTYTSKLDPTARLPILVGCGIWGRWYGYVGGGVDVDQIWADKATGLVLREEGFDREPGKPGGRCSFTIEYGDFEDVGPNWFQAPRHVVITFLGERESPPPLVFDLHFTTVGGKVWLMDALEETQEGKLTTKAYTSGVTVEEPLW